MKFQTAYDTIASFLVRNNATMLEIEALNCMASYCKSVETRQRAKPRSNNTNTPNANTPADSPFTPSHPATEFQAGAADRKGAPWTPDEEDALIASFGVDNDINRVANEHGRTPEAIAKRLVKLGKYHTLDDVPGYIQYREAEARKKGKTYIPSYGRNQQSH